MAMCIYKIQTFLPWHYKNLGTFLRVRAGASEINITFASCKQTSAFPSEPPGARFWEHKQCAKSSVLIPSSKDNHEQT